MNLTRRRFITIAAAAAVPTGATAVTWQGRAFGADTSITLDASGETADAAIHAAIGTIRRIEAQFNLYDPSSAIVALNSRKQITNPDPMFVELLGLSDIVHDATGGLFNPAVGAMWRASASGAPVDPSALNWDQVQYDHQSITIGPNQILTLNGIAQGFATDLITQTLADFGLTSALVNIGEYRALGGPYQLGVSDPHHGLIGRRQITDAAIATSSPAALFVGAQTHIMHAARTPQWSTVSVEAETAAIADAFSTALCLANLNEIHTAAQHPAIRRIMIVDKNGDLSTI